MKAVFLLILAIALLYFGCRYIFLRIKKQFQRFNKSSSSQKKRVRSISKERPGAKEKGDDFERFVLNLFDFESKRFVLKEWRSDKIFNGIYPESNHYPDFEIQLNTKSGLVSFAVECKYRSSWKQNNTIEWAKSYQVNNYKNYAAHYNIPVFVVLGVGGQPGNPEELYIFSLHKINNSIIGYNNLQKSRKTDLRAKLFYNHEYQSLK